MAETKVSKADVRYQDHPRGPHRCSTCTMFRAPAGCSYVVGQISRDGWCRAFEPQMARKKTIAEA